MGGLNHQLEKENDLPKLHFRDSMLDFFGGVSQRLYKYSQSIQLKPPTTVDLFGMILVGKAPHCCAKTSFPRWMLLGTLRSPRVFVWLKIATIKHNIYNLIHIKYGFHMYC